MRRVSNGGKETDVDKSEGENHLIEDHITVIGNWEEGDRKLTLTHTHTHTRTSTILDWGGVDLKGLVYVQSVLS